MCSLRFFIAHLFWCSLTAGKNLHSYKNNHTACSLIGFKCLWHVIFLFRLLFSLNWNSTLIGLFLSQSNCIYFAHKGIFRLFYVFGHICSYDTYFGCILRTKFIFWLYFGDTILMRHVLKLYFEMTILPKKSHCYFDIAVIGMYTRRQWSSRMFQPLVAILNESIPHPF
jgi:hypothetical protein